MNIRNFQKLGVMLLLLTLFCQPLKIYHFQQGHLQKAKAGRLNSAKNQESTFVIIPIIGGSKKLTDFNISNLNSTQKGVDAFIRNKSNVGDSNLTAASGDGKNFVYTYENKTENKSQVWIISVCSYQQSGSQAAKSNKTQETQNSSNQTSTQPNNATKFVISGVNYIENSKLTDEKKKKMDKQLNQKFEKIEKQFDTSFSALMNAFDQLLN